jgi:hypothetical protein
MLISDNQKRGLNEMSNCLLQFIQLVRLQMAVDKLDKNYGKCLTIKFLFDGVRI